MREIIIKLRRSPAWQTVLIVGLFTILCCGFGVSGWPVTFAFTVRSLAVIVLFLFLVFLFLGEGLSQKQNFRYFVMVLAFLPFLSVFYSYSEYDQPVLDGIKGTLPSLLWLSYFVLHRLKLKENSFLKAMLYIAVFILLVQVIQQFTYPHIWFGGRNVENLTANQELAEKRNGLWRFQIGVNGIFTAVCLFYYWCKMRRKMKIPYPVIVALMIVSIYLTLTRQIIFSAVLTLLLSFFISRKNMKIWPLLAGLILVGVISMYWDVLFESFQKLTTSDIGSKNYIRFLSANYFWTETFSSAKTAILGHGTAISGDFLSLKTKLAEDYQFHVSDVGFIGIMWTFGVPYVMVCYALLIYVFAKYRHYIPMYISLFIIFMIVPSAMIFPMNSPIKYMLWSFLLYICDRHINRTKRLRLIHLYLQKRKLEASTAYES